MKILLLSLVLVALIVLPAHFAYTGIRDGLVIYLPFDEGDGDIAKDLSGNGNDATISAAEWAEGKYGKAIATAVGGTNCVRVPHSESLMIEGEITIMVWLKTTEYNKDLVAQVLGKGANTDQESTSYSLYLDQGFIGASFGSDQGKQSHKSLLGRVKLNEWTHVAVTLDANVWTAYVNGKKGETKETGYKFMGTNALPIDIACPAERANYSYIGAIDEVYIYRRALSEAEVNYVMNSGLSVEAKDKLSTTWASIKVQ